MNSSKSVSVDASGKSSFEAARLISRGLRPIPIPSGSKGPRIPNWQTTIFEPAHFSSNENIGVLIHGNLVCVDLDDEIAVEMAGDFLPATGVVIGRKQRPRCHWFYRVDGSIPQKKFSLLIEDNGAHSKVTSIELFTSESPRQVVVGPSVHPTGDEYDLFQGEPTTVNADELLMAIKALGTAVETRYRENGRLIQQTEPKPYKPKKTTRKPSQDKSPVDTYKATYPGDLLIKHGWIRFKDSTHKGRYQQLWSRPGKTPAGISASLTEFDNTWSLFIFTSNASYLEQGQAYNPHALLAALEFGGDYRAASASISGNGFGDEMIVRKSNNIQCAHGVKDPKSGPKSTDQNEDWPTEVNIQNDELMPVKSPPLHTLPKPLVDYILNQAERMNCPPDFGAISLLVFSGSMVGNAGTIRVLDRNVPCIIWAAVIGEPGAGKTAPMAEMVKRIRTVDSVAQAEWANRDRLYKAAKEQYEAVTEKVGGGAYPKPAPKKQTLYLSDFTIEKLCSDLNSNPKGLLVFLDELSGFIRSMNRYTSGGSQNGERSKHLEGWSAGEMKTSRKNAEMDLIVKHPHYGICGGIQPDILSELITQERGSSIDDGFIDRFLFAYPAKLPPRGAVDLKIDPESKQALESMFDKLISLEIQMKIPSTGKRITLSAWRTGDYIQVTDPNELESKGNLSGLMPDNPGRDEFVVAADDGEGDIPLASREVELAWMKLSAEFADKRTKGILPQNLENVWSKMEAYFLRIANVIQHIWWAAGTVPDRVMTVAALEAAKEWVEYFCDHTLKAHGVMTQRTIGKDCFTAREWIMQQKGETFLKADLRAATRGKMSRDTKRLDAALIELENYRLIEPVQTKAEGRGRIPSRYRINPKLKRN